MKNDLMFLKARSFNPRSLHSTLSLGKLTHTHGYTCHLYTDNSSIYFSSPILSSTSHTNGSKYLLKMSSWSQKHLRLNISKTQFMTFFPNLVLSLNPPSRGRTFQTILLVQGRSNGGTLDLFLSHTHLSTILEFAS